MRNAFSDVITRTDEIFLQIKYWGGMFIDLVDQDVPDRSIWGQISHQKVRHLQQWVCIYSLLVPLCIWYYKDVTSFVGYMWWRIEVCTWLFYWLVTMWAFVPVNRPKRCYHWCKFTNALDIGLYLPVPVRWCFITFVGASIASSTLVVKVENCPFIYTRLEKHKKKM